MTGIILLILRLFFAVSLYLFLIWIIYTLWQELKNQSKTLEIRKVPPITLELDIDGQPSKKTFYEPEIILGRNLTCDFCLEDHTVSAEHARLIFRQGQWWVEDLQSKNGTFLNQLPVNDPVV
ncbi:MAG: FHA domain-containing protein, partial [Chloroflexi bacterium]|nr:FHA domain-containing protein [Chloroflexota bacterium]